MPPIIITKYLPTKDEEEKKEPAPPVSCKLGSTCYIQDPYHKLYYIHYMID